MYNIRFNLVPIRSYYGYPTETFEAPYGMTFGEWIEKYTTNGFYVQNGYVHYTYNSRSMELMDPNRSFTYMPAMTTIELNQYTWGID